MAEENERGGVYVSSFFFKDAISAACIVPTPTR